MERAKKNYELPSLTFELDALEPILSREAMELHYLKHHRGYVNNLNDALDRYHEAETKNDILSMVHLQSSIRFNGGGHLNHTLFWENLTPVDSKKNQSPEELLVAIKKNFGSFESFKEEFNSQALMVQGSGWAWLVYNKLRQTLEVTVTKNHDLISSIGLVPLLIVDVWEHAYYLQYKNERNTFLKAIWQIINLEEVNRRYEKAME